VLPVEIRRLKFFKENHHAIFVDIRYSNLNGEHTPVLPYEINLMGEIP
jgi:hypothetical protein